jgi:hypothetical protein
MADRGNPLAVRVGPGILYIAPLESTEPTDLDTPWDGDWTPLGYTDAGSEFVIDQTFEDVLVAEELDPVLTLQTARTTTVNFALAEITAANMQRALNGGVIDTGVGIVTFEPPGVGEYTHVMIGWEAEDGLERWVFRKCLQVGSVNIARRRAPDKATIPMSFRCSKPAGVAAWIQIHDTDYVEPGSS